jgi:hypothetical protein
MHYTTAYISCKRANTQWIRWVTALHRLKKRNKWEMRFQKCSSTWLKTSVLLKNNNNYGQQKNGSIWKLMIRWRQLFKEKINNKKVKVKVQLPHWSNHMENSHRKNNVGDPVPLVFNCAVM